MSGITKTIPQTDGVEAVEALYDGRVGEFEFHMAGKMSLKLQYIKQIIINELSDHGKYSLLHLTLDLVR